MTTNQAIATAAIPTDVLIVVGNIPTATEVRHVAAA